MLDTQKALIEIRMQLLFVDDLRRVWVIIVAIGAEEVGTIDLETPLQELQQEQLEPKGSGNSHSFAQ